MPPTTVSVAKGLGVPIDMGWIAPLKAIFHLDAIGVEYQPLVDLDTGAAIGYEGLARFYGPSGETISNDRVFPMLRRLPAETFFNAERDLKRLQILNSPKCAQLFLNFDPCCVTGLEPKTAARRVAGLFHGRDGIVVEIVEHRTALSVSVADEVAAILSESGIPLALDDIGAPGAVMSLNQLKLARFLKFDSRWLSRMDSDGSERHYDFLHAMIGYARAAGKKTVLEGVETDRHMSFAREAGFDFVQGFLFRERFHSVEQPIREHHPVDGHALTVSRCSLMPERRTSMR